MKSKLICISVSLLILLNISACSGVKEYFPDKHKDYQLITEIPELTVPSDLSDDAIQHGPKSEDITPVIQTTDKENELPESDSVENTEDEENLEKEKEKEKDKDKDKAIYVDLLEFSGGATRIRIEDTLDRTWRTVGKAISRHSIEITDRNELESVYFVQYDAEFEKIEDGSLWDEALFIFGSDPAQEKEFRIKLVENGDLVEVIVLDSNDVPLSKGPGLKLLRLLYETIKDDLAGTD